MFKRSLFSVSCLVFVLAFAGVADAMKTFKMKTIVKDHVTTKWTLQCPDGGTIDLGKVSMTEEGSMEFFDCLNQIESEVGVKISSKTKVKDFVTEEDIIKSETEMSEEQAQKLCDIINDNLIPEVAVTKGKPRIQTLVVDGVTTSITIDLGGGCIIDLTGANLTPQQLQQMLDLIDQIEQQNGIHIAGQTQGGGEDRVLGVTTLSGQDIQNILQTAQALGIAIPPDLWIFQGSALAVIDLGGDKAKVELEGPVMIRLGPQPGGTFDTEIISMSLTGTHPQLGTVTVQPAAPAPGQLQPKGTKPGKFDYLQDFPIQILLPDQALDLELLPQPAVGTGRVKAPLRKDIRLRIPGKLGLTESGGIPVEIGSLKLGRVRLGLPAHTPLLPLGP